jgi:precorrin-6A/cobalt-precorrin-6A reductase
VDPAPDRAGVIWVTGFSSGDVETEARMMAGHFATHLVTKDSGGPRAKLDAATSLGIAVHVIDRPPCAPGKETHDIDRAIAFVRAHAADRDPR